MQFNSQQQAKQYLVSRIVAEAERKGVQLSEVERKMLYFSETDWTLPGILDVNAEFERDYDDDAYEKKIAGLARSLEDQASPEEQHDWDDAVVKLGEGDHYLLVLIGATGNLAIAAPPAMRRLSKWLPAMDASAKRDSKDRLRLLIVALAIFAAIIVYAMLSHGR